MPRKPRFTLPGIPQHVIQRGNNREPCFLAEALTRYISDKYSLTRVFIVLGLLKTRACGAQAADSSRVLRNRVALGSRRQ